MKLSKILHTLCLASALASFAALPTAMAQDLKQLALTDQQVIAFITAQKDFQPLAGKLLEGGDKPNDALLGELENIAKKHGFASFAEFEDVGANITLVLDGLDRKSGQYTDPIDKMKVELADIEKDSTIPDEDKKLAIDDLKQEIAVAKPLEFKGNVEVVKKHQADLEKLMVDGSGDSAAGGTEEPDGAPAAPAPASPEAVPAAPAPAAPAALDAK